MGKDFEESFLSAMMIKQLPLKLRSASKNDVRSQFAALCYRTKADRTEILLITSRRTGRWIVPKGWPEDGMTPADCALKEAWEEAGVTGRAQDRCLGLYSYAKVVSPKVTLPCVARVYPVKVQSLSNANPVHSHRQRNWFSHQHAANTPAATELRRIPPACHTPLLP